MQVTVTTWPTPLRMFVNVTASSGVAAAWGIHHYLKYSPIGAHFSWMANNLSESKITCRVAIFKNQLENRRGPY